MARRLRTIRPPMTRPLRKRRSATVVGEIRIYQELISLAVESARLRREYQTWAEKGQGLTGQIQSIEQYQQELLRRLGLGPADPLGVQSPKAPDQGPAETGNPGVMELRYCSTDAAEKS